MEEPNIEQFGLSRVDYIYLNKHKDRGHKAIKAISISIAFLAVASIYWHVYSADDIGLRIFQSLIAGLFMGSISGYLIEKVIWLLYVDIRNRYSGQYQKLNQYEAAKTKYNSWWRRNQESFWTSLSGKQFESELASLYSKLGYEVESPKRGGAIRELIFY